MPTTRDEKFAEAVLKRGLLSKGVVRRCLAEMKRAESIGATVSLDAVLVTKGLISRQQADELVKSLARRPALKSIGGFELIEEIGRGGMGTVYKARQVSMDRLVALKVLLPRLAKNRSYVERFITEARAVARLSHAHIIQGYDVGEASGYYYFAMEYIDGESLAARLAHDGKIGEAEALAIIEQVCRALAHARAAANIIHRDIKPDNIMMTKDGAAKLADLGLARMPGSPGRQAAGTPHYVSPEQAAGRSDIDIRSDIYSLGATLYHMTTGVPPFTGASAREVISKHLSAAPLPPRSINPALSVGVSRLMTAMMEKAPEERYQTVDELLEDVRLVQAGRPPQWPIKRGLAGSGAPRAAPQPAGSESHVALIVVILLFAAMAGIAVAMVARPGANERRGRPTDDGLEAAAARAFDEAKEFESATPWAVAEAAEKYVKVASDHPQTSWGRKAKAKAEMLRRELEEKAGTVFAELKTKADGLAAQEHYTRAIAELRSYPERLRFGRWGKAVASQIAKHREKLIARIREIKQQAEEQAENRDYEKAVKTARQGLAFGDETMTRWVHRKISEYRQRARQWEQRQDERQADRARREFDRLLATVISAEQQHAYGSAVTACDRYLKRHLGKYSGQARELKVEAETAQDVWHDALGALKRSVGNALEIRARGIMLKGKLRKVSSKTFTVETNITTITKKLIEIDPEDLLSLAGVIGDDRLTILRRARFFLAAGAFDEALATAGRLDDEDLQDEWKAKIARREELYENIGSSARENPTDTRTYTPNKP